jgi:U32 family peptidase
MRHELLAPVGDFQKLYTAIDAGADAVYLGLQEFNMRDTAKNFKTSDLKKIKNICENSPRKPKVYLTLNTIIYDSELKKLENLIKKIKGQIDSVICWDMSVINLCRKYKIPFHISTQASVSNIEAAKFYKRLGAERIVLARELNLNQIKKISEVIPTECFIHGAMCVSISGRCFTSQFVHGLSANRGQCIHPCRRAYTVKDNSGNELQLRNNRIMSAKDLCTLPFIDKIKKTGVTSFKIEGRSRSLEYVKIVTEEYRKAIDKKLSREEINKGLNELRKVYNRDFSSGFYIKMPTSDDFSYSENGEQNERKEFVGRVEKYWQKAGAATVKMFSGRIKAGDEIYLISKNRAIKRFTVESLEKDGKSVESAKKGEEVGIKLPRCSIGDDIYIIRKKE